MDISNSLKKILGNLPNGWSSNYTDIKTGLNNTLNPQPATTGGLAVPKTIQPTGGQTKIKTDSVNTQQSSSLEDKLFSGWDKVINALPASQPNLVSGASQQWQKEVRDVTKWAIEAFRGGLAENQFIKNIALNQNQSARIMSSPSGGVSMAAAYVALQPVEMAKNIAQTIPRFLAEATLSLADVLQGTKNKVTEPVVTLPKEVELSPLMQKVFGTDKLRSWGVKMNENTVAIQSAFPDLNPNVSVAGGIATTSIGVAFDAWVTASVAKSLLRQLVKFAPDVAQNGAWAELGFPKTMPEAKASYLDLAKVYHPDKATGNAVTFMRVNEAYKLLEQTGIPDTSSIKSLVGRTAQALLSDPKNAASVFFYGPTTTPTTQTRLALPGYVSETPNVPRVGLQVEKVIPAEIANKLKLVGSLGEAKTSLTPQELLELDKLGISLKVALESVSGIISPDDLIARVEKEQAKALTSSQKTALTNLENVSVQSEQTKFYKREEIQSWMTAVKRLQSEKELSNMTVSKIKQSLNIAEMKNSSQPELQELYSFMEGLEKGDSFLSDKQVQSLSGILQNIENVATTPKRVLIDQFGEKTDILPNGIVGKIANELFPTVDIKEGHPLVSKIVDKADDALFRVSQEVERRDAAFETMIASAEKSRSARLKMGEKIQRKLVPQDKEIFRALSGEKVELTKEEKAVVAYAKNFFKKVKNDLQLEKYRQNYVTHLEKPLTEKIVSDGLISAIKDIFKLRKSDNIPINVMLELDKIIGSEQFFRFALQRKGGISPTTNLRKIIHDYSSLFETKKALDAILPEATAITKLLLQPKSAQWTSNFLKNLKGRGLDFNFRTGKMGWLTKIADGIIDISYLKLLGLNYISAAKNIVAGEANSFIYQDFITYLRGKKRLAIAPKRTIRMALRYGVLEGTFADYAQKGIGKLKKLQDFTMILQQAGEYEIRASIFAAELTPEEFKSGEISVERVREIKDIIAITQGLFSKTDSPVWLQTWYGRLYMQMNRWRITNAMMFRRVLKGSVKEQRAGKRFGRHTKKLAKMFIMYGIGMYLNYQLARAGYKRAAKVATAMAETVNSIIEALTLKPITDALTDNPTLSILKEFAFTIQELASYIKVPGVEKPSKVEFQQGIEDTYIAPVAKTKELFGVTEGASSPANDKKSAIDAIMGKYQINTANPAQDILDKYSVGQQDAITNILKKYNIH
jgi:hypothetical protein